MIKTLRKNRSGRRKSKEKKRKNATTNPSPRHHENYGAAALGGGVGIPTSNLSISDICFDISNSILGMPRGRWKNLQKREKLIFRRIKKNELRRSERENRVGFPGRVKFAYERRFEEEEEQKREEENASSSSKNS